MSFCADCAGLYCGVDEDHKRHSPSVPLFRQGTAHASEASRETSSAKEWRYLARGRASPGGPARSSVAPLGVCHPFRSALDPGRGLGGRLRELTVIRLFRQPNRRALPRARPSAAFAKDLQLNKKRRVQPCCRGSFELHRQQCHGTGVGAGRRGGATTAAVLRSEAGHRKKTTTMRTKASPARRC